MSHQIFFLKIVFSNRKFFCHKFWKKIVTFLQLWKKLMHKNAIKMVGRVIFLENSEFFDKNLAENLCFSRVLRLFASCFSCYFGSTFVFFKKKFLATLVSVPHFDQFWSDGWFSFWYDYQKIEKNQSRNSSWIFYFAFNYAWLDKQKWGWKI